MGNLFGYDSKLMSVLNKVMDALLLGVLWLACSIPIITMGASSTAFYYAYHKSVRQERGYAWQEFFSALRSNFKQSTKMWLFILGVIVFGIADFVFLSMYMEIIPGAKILMGILFIFLAFVTMWGLCVFPYQARFEDEAKAVLKNTAIIMAANYQWALAILLVFVVALLGIIFFPLSGLFVPPVYMWFANHILEHVFKKYMDIEDITKEREFAEGVK